MKNILFIHQYFKTPEEGGSLRSYFIARGLVENGFKVHMLTAHNEPQFEIKEIEGITVHYIPIPYSNNMPFSLRYKAFLKFVFASIRRASKMPKPELIYATSTPLTIGLIALWMKWRRGISFIFEVRDLWPEAPIQLGIMKNPIAKQLSLKLEKTLYKKASGIIALSPGIELGIKVKVPTAKTTLIPNMADIDFFQRSGIKRKHEEQFTIGYFGAFGMANNIEFIIQIAQICQQRQLPIRFILVGEGSKKEFLENRIQQLQLINTELHPMKNRFEIRDLIGYTDACITTFLHFPILETNSPNKFFDGLAAGKLSIVNTSGWLRKLVETNECGFYIDPLRPELFPDTISPFLHDRLLLEKYQQNARKLAVSKFSKDMLVDRAVSEVKQLLNPTNT